MLAAKIVLILSLVMSGCSFMSSRPEAPEVLRIHVPFPVACAPSIPPKPPLTLYKLPKNAGSTESLKSALVDLWTIDQYSDELRALLSGCNNDKVIKK